MNISLTIEEAIECFGRPMIAQMIESGLRQRHTSELMQTEEYERIRNNRNLVPFEMSQEARKEFFDRNKLNLVIVGSEIYQEEKRKRTPKKKQLKLSIPQVASLNDLYRLFGPKSEERVVENFNDAIGISAKNSIRRK